MVEQEIALRHRLQEKARGAMEDTRFDEILLFELHDAVARARARHQAEPDVVEVWAGQQRHAEARADVGAHQAGGGSELDGLRLLAGWRDEHPDVATPELPVAVGVALPGTLPPGTGWLLTVRLAPVGEGGVAVEPLVEHLLLPAAPTAIGASDLEGVVRRLASGGEPVTRPTGPRAAWTEDLLALDRALQAWRAGRVAAHNSAREAVVADRMRPAARRTPSGRLREQALEASDMLVAEIGRLEAQAPDRLTPIEERLVFLVNEVLAPERIHELLASQDEVTVSALLQAMRDQPRRFLLEDFDPMFDRLCGARWAERGTAQLPLPNEEGRWTDVSVRVLAATWCAQ